MHSPIHDFSTNQPALDLGVRPRGGIYYISHTEHNRPEYAWISHQCAPPQIRVFRIARSSSHCPIQPVLSHRPSRGMFSVWVLLNWQVPRFTLRLYLTKGKLNKYSPAAPLYACLVGNDLSCCYLPEYLPQPYPAVDDNITQIALLISVTLCLIILIISITFIYLR